VNGQCCVVGGELSERGDTLLRSCTETPDSPVAAVILPIELDCTKNARDVPPCNKHFRIPDNLVSQYQHKIKQKTMNYIVSV